MTPCKNCQLPLNKSDSYCNTCGARVIKQRITLKGLLENVLNALGWDSNFAITLRYLFYKPQVVFNGYINGARKKFANPFSFYAVLIAISIFVFSQYSDQLVQMSTDLSLDQTELIENIKSENSEDVEIFGYKNESEFKQALIKYQLKYYNLFAFIMLPIYTLIAFFVFGKPYNYAEHLVVNTYIQAVTSLLSILLFISSILFGVNLFGSGVMLLPFLYYCFAYKKFYELSFGKLLLKTLKFLGVMFVMFLIPLILGIVVAVLNQHDL